MLRRNRGCVYVCMYVCNVCVCVGYVRPCVAALMLKRTGRFWLNFVQLIWLIFAMSVFLGFWNSEIDDVIAAILQVFSGALSQSKFLSDLLQNWTWCRVTSPPICYLKTAKLVGNFQFYEEPRVRTRAVHDIWRSGVQSLLGALFQDFFFVLSYLTNSDLLVTNHIIFFLTKMSLPIKSGKSRKMDATVYHYLLQFFLF